MLPPIKPTPLNSAMSARPFVPPEIFPPTYAMARPIKIAMAEPCTRPNVSLRERNCDTITTRPTTANAATSPFSLATFSRISIMALGFAFVRWLGMVLLRAVDERNETSAHYHTHRRCKQCHRPTV